MTSPSAKSSPFPKLPENCDVCDDQLPSHLARIGVARHPPMPRRRPHTVGEHGRQESAPTRPITGHRSISTIERRVRFMIVKVGDSLGETFGHFVGRLAATLAVLTPVIPAFRASVLIVHPKLPDRDHAAMLTMVKDGSWFRLAHRHSPSMAFYRARPSADTLKQDELRAAGQCSERWRRPRVVGRWMRRPWSEFTGVPGIPCPPHGAFAVSRVARAAQQNLLGATAVCHHQAALIARGLYCSE